MGIPHCDEIEGFRYQSNRAAGEPHSQLSSFDRDCKCKASARVAAHNVMHVPDHFPLVLCVHQSPGMLAYDV